MLGAFRFMKLLYFNNSQKLFILGFGGYLNDQVAKRLANSGSLNCKGKEKQVVNSGLTYMLQY